MKFNLTKSGTPLHCIGNGRGLTYIGMEQAISDKLRNSYLIMNKQQKQIANIS